MSRFSNRRLLKNDLEEYEEFFEERNVKQITHFGTGVLNYPSVGQVLTLQSVQKVWTTGWLLNIMGILVCGGILAITTKSLLNLT